MGDTFWLRQANLLSHREKVKLEAFKDIDTYIWHVIVSSRCIYWPIFHFIKTNIASKLNFCPPLETSCQLGKTSWHYWSLTDDKCRYILLFLFLLIDTISLLLRSFKKWEFLMLNTFCSCIALNLYTKKFELQGKYLSKFEL